MYLLKSSDGTISTDHKNIDRNHWHPNRPFNFDISENELFNVNNYIQDGI